MIALKNRLNNGGLPIWSAVFCLDCQMITSSRGDQCSGCNGRLLVSLARILGGSLFAHREQTSQGGNELFDATITVELQQLHAKDLTTALERLTSVIGPKLAKDQAAFHIDVKPSLDRPKTQGLLSFPEREAA